MKKHNESPLTFFQPQTARLLPLSIALLVNSVRHNMLKINHIVCTLSALNILNLNLNAHTINLQNIEGTQPHIALQLHASLFDM